MKKVLVRSWDTDKDWDGGVIKAAEIEFDTAVLDRLAEIRELLASVPGADYFSIDLENVKITVTEADGWDEDDVDRLLSGKGKLFVTLKIRQDSMTWVITDHNADVEYYMYE